MNNFLKEEKFSFHLIFLFVLSLYYLIPYFFTGQLILKPSDILDGEIVYNHIIGKFYRGEPESIDLFIGGEIKWYFLRRILQPLTLLYAFFETETAFWVTDIIVKLICYISFFKLAKKLKCSNFNSSLVGCLYACSIYSWTHFGIGIAAFPYLIYLLVKNKDLKLRNYFIISFIGLNSDLATDFFVLPLLFAIFLIFCFKNLKSNFQIFLKISILFIFFNILLSNANMIYSLLIDLPFHRNTMIYPDISLTENCKRFFYNFLSIPYFNRVYFFHDIPYTFFSAPIVLFSLFNANKETRLFLLIIFLMCLVYFILNLNGS